MNLAQATIGQLLIPVEDFDRGVSFYRDVLGLPFLFAAPPQMAFFTCGSVRLLVGVMPKGQNAQRGSAIYFQVTDIHAVFSTLCSRTERTLRLNLMWSIARRSRSCGWPSSTTPMAISSLMSEVVSV